MKRSPSVCSVKCRVPASTRRHIARRLTQARAAACSALIMGTCSPHDGHQAWTKPLGLLMASSCLVSIVILLLFMLLPNLTGGRLKRALVCAVSLAALSRARLYALRGGYCMKGW